MSEVKVTAALVMDRSEALGNSEDVDTRRALHVKVKNKLDEPVPILGSKFSMPQEAVCYTYETGTVGIYFTEIYKFYSGGTPDAPVGLLKTITLYYSDVGLENEVGGLVS